MLQDYLSYFTQKKIFIKRGKAAPSRMLLVNPQAVQ